MVPKFSIVVPVFNAQAHISDTINSVRSQTYEDWELILVNDGSSDSSAVICQSFADKDSRIHLFNKANGGVSSARNIGIEKARSEYILFLDSDDLLVPHCLSSLLPYLGSDLIVYSFIKNFGNGRQQEKNIISQTAQNKKTANNLLANLKCGQGTSEVFCFPWNKVYKTSLLKQNNITFPEDICFREDEIFVYRYQKVCESVRVIPDCLCQYNCQYSTLTRKERPADAYRKLAKYIVEESEDLAENIRDSSLFKSLQYRRAVIYLFHAMTLSVDYQEQISILTDLRNIYQKSGVKQCGLKNSIVKLEPILLLLLRYHLEDKSLLRDLFAKIWRYKYLSLLNI